MKLFVRALSLLPCVALLIAAAPTANAAPYSVNGSVWEGQSGPNVVADPSGVSYTTLLGTPTDTFTVSNTSATSLFNFYSVDDGSGATGGLNGFLTTNPSSTSNGDTVTGITSGTKNDSINNDLFQFTGTTTLTSGNTYTFSHDDGLLLYLNGLLVINDGAPTSPETTYFQVLAGSGTDTTGCTSGGSTCVYYQGSGGSLNFTLDYAEVAGPPAELTTNLPLTSPVVPEPSSIMLLGTGLLAAAGMVRRRFVA